MADNIEEFWDEIRPAKEPSEEKQELQAASADLNQKLDRVERGLDELEGMARSRASISGEGRIHRVHRPEDPTLMDRLLDNMSPQQAAAALPREVSTSFLADLHPSQRELDEISQYENERNQLRTTRLPWDQASFVEHVFHEWSRMTEAQRRLLRDHILRFESRYHSPTPPQNPQINPTRGLEDLTNALASLGFPAVIELEYIGNPNHRELTINLGRAFLVEVDTGPDGTDIVISPSDREESSYKCSKCEETEHLETCIHCLRPICPAHRVGTGDTSVGYTCKGFWNSSCQPWWRRALNSVGIRD